jgi:chromosomal replication initiation ATPase DnaA
MKEQIEITINVVASHYKVHPDEITGPSRVQPLPEARMMLVRMLREYFSPEVMINNRIASIIKRDRANISRLDEKFQTWIRLYPDIREKYERICTLISMRGYEKKAENTPTRSAAPAAELHAEKQQAV